MRLKDARRLIEEAQDPRIADLVNRSGDIVERFIAGQRAEGERRALLVLDEHQSRSGRPIAGLLADMPPDLLADLHDAALDTGNLHHSVFDICRCAACDRMRRLGRS